MFLLDRISPTEALAETVGIPILAVAIVVTLVILIYQILK